MADQPAATAAITPTSVPTPAEAADPGISKVTGMESSSGATQTQEALETLKEDIQEAPKEAPKPSKKKLEIKYNGKKEAVEFDPNDDEYLAQQFQLAKLGQAKAQEFATLQKEVFKFIEDLKKDPRKVLSDPTIGVDVKKLAASILQEEIENSKKSPEQLEKEKLQKELQAAKDQLEREKEQFRQQELSRLQENAFQQYDTTITNALEKSELPKSPYVVKRMADYMLLGLQNGIDINADDVLPLVRDEMKSDLKEMFGVMPADVIESIVGKDNLNKIRKNSMAKAKQVPPVPVKTAIKDVGQTKAKEEAPKPPMSYKQFFGV
jgi:hypothetical protein